MTLTSMSQGVFADMGWPGDGFLLVGYEIAL